MASSPMPFTKPQWFTDSGVMASSYKLFTYDAGTTTKRNTYTDSALTSANSNPIVLDAFGRASVYLLPQSYKFVLAPPTDSDPPIAPIWTADNVPASATLFTNFDLSGTAGEVITLNDVVYLSDGSGGNTAGRWYKADADFTYASTTAFEIGIALASAASATALNIRQVGKMTGLTGLTAGTVYYVSATAGALTSTAPSNAIVVGKADTTTSLILDPSWGNASTVGRGLMGLQDQTFAGAKTFVYQVQTDIGAATTLPAQVGGVYFTDVVSHTVPQNQTQAVMSSTTIPANMLDTDGMSICVDVGGTTAWTGGAGKVLFINIDGNHISIESAAGNADPYWIQVIFTRVSATQLRYAIQTWAINAAAGSVGVAFILSGAVFNFGNSMVLKSEATTGAGDTVTQTLFIVRNLG